MSVSLKRFEWREFVLFWTEKIRPSGSSYPFTVTLWGKCIYICFFYVKNWIWYVFPLRIIYCNDQLLNLECINYYRLNLINQIHIRNAILSMLFLLLNVNRKVMNDIYKLDIINLCVKSVNINRYICVVSICYSCTWRYDKC